MAIKKVFIYNKPIVLTTAAERYLLDNINSAHFLFLKGAEAQNFRTALKHLEQPNSFGVVIEDSNLDALVSELKKSFTNIIAAGGVVRNPENALLMIYRRGKWDLPKGKLEQEENLEECAYREVREETGINDLKIIKTLSPSYHLYYEKEELLLKITYWFLMESSDHENLAPDLSEQITEVKWIPTEKQTLYLSETFESIKEIVQESIA